MKKSTNQILQYDSRLNSNIAEIIELFDQTSQTKTYSLNRIESTLERTIEDAHEIKENIIQWFIFFNITKSFYDFFNFAFSKILLFIISDITILK